MKWHVHVLYHPGSDSQNGPQVSDDKLTFFFHFTFCFCLLEWYTHEKSVFLLADSNNNKSTWIIKGYKTLCCKYIRYTNHVVCEESTAIIWSWQMRKQVLNICSASTGEKWQAGIWTPETTLSALVIPP